MWYYKVITLQFVAAFTWVSIAWCVHAILPTRLPKCQ